MKKRSFIAALAMLVVSAIVLTSATFAWFTMGKKVTVSQFNATVSDADGLLISAYETHDFSTSVDLDTIRTAADADLLAPTATGKISPVSSNGTITSGKLTFVEGYLNDSNQLVTSNATAGTYYQLPLYIKYSGTTAATIKLGVTQSGSYSGTTVTQGSGSSGTSAYKAVRIATNQGSSTNYILAPATDDTTFSAVTTTGTGVSASAITNVKTDGSDNALAFTLQPGSTTKILVYVWLEGTDNNCTDDAAAGGDFNVDLAFIKAS